MTEAEALDMAAKAAGWDDFADFTTYYHVDDLKSIRAHAKTIMENAALKAEVERLTAILAELNDTDIVARTMADNAALKAENERLFDALFDAIALIGHVVPMNTTALVGGEKLTALNVWQAGHDLMFPKRQARAALKEIEGD